MKLSLGILAEAERYLNKALETNNHCKKAILGKVLFLLYCQDYPEAEIWFEKYLEQNPHWVSSHFIYLLGTEIFSASRNAKKMVEFYIIEVSEFLREETLNDAEENKRFLRQQLDQTSDVLLKEKIYILLANEIEKETFARAQKYYSFTVLDPPIVPDLNKKVKPKRRIICILSVTVVFFTAVLWRFFWNTSTI